MLYNSWEYKDARIWSNKGYDKIFKYIRFSMSHSQEFWRDFCSQTTHFEYKPEISQEKLIILIISRNKKQNKTKAKTWHKHFVLYWGEAEGVVRCGMEHKHEHDTINMAQTEFSKTLECGHKTSIPYAFKGFKSLHIIKFYGHLDFL